MSKELYGLKILVVDDDQDTRDLLEWVLRRVGAEVVAVPSAQAAMEALERDLPHILVSDIAMPEEDGLSLMRRIRRPRRKKGHPMSNPTTPAPHIPTRAHPLSTPRLPTDTGPTIPAPAFFADPITGMPTMLPTDDKPRTLTTEERIARLTAEKRNASFGRQQEINGELEELEIRLQYEKKGHVTW
jgi:CheY-like chemotaxis protein